MNILGISAFYHDSAACLVRDGEIVAAAQEERFSRQKHDASFPQRAIDYCLAEAGISPRELDYVAFYDKPILKFDRILETYISYSPRGFRLFLAGLPLWLRQKLHLPRELDRGLHGEYQGPYVFTDHHESHAASAFYPSPFEEAAIVTLDGVGEWATGSIGVGSGRKMRLIKELHFPHSLGMLYSAFTYYTGFRVNSGEYKLMGLAPYGEPIHKDLILDELIDLKDDGSFRMNMSYFAYGYRNVMTSRRFNRLFAGQPRVPESPITRREMDLAASIQSVAEEIVGRITSHAHDLTGQKNLVMAGGVALNCVANGRVLREGPFDDVWVQPAAGDAGGALGAAMFVWHQLLENRRVPSRPDGQCGSLLGPSFSSDQVKGYLDSVGASYRRYSYEELVPLVADLIASGQVVGHMAGRMEFGPRALGARSILGDARSPDMQSKMNLKIKFRESFRPFAPAVLRESVHDYFAMRHEEDSPYMLLVAPVLESRRTVTDETSAEGLAIVNEVRSDIPAVTHVDYSARVQTVDGDRSPRFHDILGAFEAATGSSVLINTSFNVRGEPIVCTPADAYRCFMATDMDVLVIEDFALYKRDQPVLVSEDERDRYLAEFELD